VGTHSFFINHRKIPQQEGLLYLRIGHPQPWSIPPWATKNLNSPLVGLFSFCGFAGLDAIGFGYPHLEVSFKRPNQLFIPASVLRQFKRRSSRVGAWDVV